MANKDDYCPACEHDLCQCSAPESRDGATIFRLVHKNEPVPEIVEALECALERAKKGELRGVVVAFYTDGHATGHNYGWAEGVTREALVGELQLAQFSMLIAMGRIRQP